MYHEKKKKKKKQQSLRNIRAAIIDWRYPVIFINAEHSPHKAFNKDIPVSILYKSTAGRYRPVRVADGSITARCRFIKNASLLVIS